MNIVQAGSISIGAVSLSSSTASSQNVAYTIVFTPASDIPSNGTIHVQFQSNMSQYSYANSSLSKGAGTSAEVSNLQNLNGQEFAAVPGGLISGGTEITIEAEGISNPSVGRYWLKVWTVNNSGTVIDNSSSVTTLTSYYTIGTPIAVGRVTDPDGDPIENAWANVHTTGNSPIGGGNNTDAQGYYSIGTINGSSVSNGTVLKISVFAPPEQFELGQTSEEEITFNGSTITKNIQFTAPTKTITGTVTYSDGDPVENVVINFWNSSGSGWAQGKTDSNGNIKASNGTSILKVIGGNWQGNPQANSNSDWSYGKPPASLMFKNDTSVESKAVNFVVERASCTVTGSVRLPNGSVPDDPQQFWAGVHSMMNGGGGQNLDSDGNFSIAISPGTYDVEISDWQQNYTASQIDPFTVAEGDTKSLGTITLIERSSHITGKAVDQNGNGISGLRLNAFMMKNRGGGGWAETQTDSSGNFTLNVFPGRWMIQVSNWGNDGNVSQYVMSGNPPEVKVASGQTVSANVSLVQTSSTISGSILDSDGNVVSDMYGWVFADRASASEMHFGPGLGGPVERGQYSFNVPPGTYNVGFGSMPGSKYSAGDMEEVTIADSETLSHNITVYENDMTISGTVKDENGDPVTGVFMEIFAANENGGWQNAMIDQSDGSYSIDVASAVDPWNIGYFIDPSTGYFSQKLTDSSVSGNSGDAITKNITVRRADATITGTVLDGDGNPMEGVFAFADNRSGNMDRQETEFMGPMFMNDSISDVNGNFTIKVPNGTYYVGASLPRDGNEDLINPEKVEVTVGENGAIGGITLSFKKTDSVITGKVKLDGEAQDGAFVWAWSDNGGYNQTEADSDGNYELNVTKNDTWHIGVNSDVVDTTDYIYSPEYAIETGSSSSNTQNITMETVEDGLVEPVSTTFEADSAKAANLSDGTRITIPANAMGESGETVTLNASSTSELPRTENAKPIGTGLDLTATSSNQEEGSTSSVTSFNSNVAISIPYDESTLDDMKVTEDDLVAAYWDETAGIWQPMDSYTIDKDNDLVVFSTNHFTQFALVSDIVTDGTSTDTGTKAKITSWKAEKYFKDVAGKIRERLKMVLKGKHFDSKAEVKIGNVEARTVKKVNSKKLIAIFSMNSLMNKSVGMKRKIKVTNPNADTDSADKKINLATLPIRVSSDVINAYSVEGIKNIQTILYNEKLLAEEYITGIFGPLTSQAVRQFQSKYGIATTGVVGPRTTAKLMECKSNF